MSYVTSVSSISSRGRCGSNFLIQPVERHDVCERRWCVLPLKLSTVGMLNLCSHLLLLCASLQCRAPGTITASNAALAIYFGCIALFGVALTWIVPALLARFAFVSGFPCSTVVCNATSLRAVLSTRLDSPFSMYLLYFSCYHDCIFICICISVFLSLLGFSNSPAAVSVPTRRTAIAPPTRRSTPPSCFRRSDRAIKHVPARSIRRFFMS